MNVCDNINGLTEEYRTLIKEQTCKTSCTSLVFASQIEDLLIDNGEWSPRAAEHLYKLATSYGSFMLCNALALSLALQIEDGKLGF